MVHMGSKEVQQEAREYVQRMVQTLIGTDNRTASKIDSILASIDRTDINSSDVWQNLKEHLPIDSPLHKTTWQALHRYHSALTLGEDGRLKTLILEADITGPAPTAADRSPSATTDNNPQDTPSEKIDKYFTDTFFSPPVFSFTKASNLDLPSTGHELTNESLRNELCHSYHAGVKSGDTSGPLAITPAKYNEYYAPGHSWVEASQDEAKYLQTKALKAPTFTGSATSIVETSDDWKNNRTISSSSHFFFKEKKYRQLGYSSNDYVDLGYEGKYWNKLDEKPSKFSYTLEQQDCTIENEQLTITNFDNIGYIDSNCVVKVDQKSGLSFFQLSAVDRKIGYFNLSGGDTLQDRTNKVIQILIIEASKNTEFLQQLLKSALQGAATYTQKYKEMNEVVNRANKINDEIKTMENYYVAEVKRIEDEVTKAKREWINAANKQFVTILNWNLGQNIDPKSNYYALKDSLQTRIRESVVAYLKNKKTASEAELSREMGLWTLPSVIQEQDTPT